MKFLFLLLIGVSLSEQSFWLFEKTPTINDNQIPTEPPTITSAEDHRYIVNILKYKVENGTESPYEFACLGTIIASDFAITPANCVNLPDPYKIAIQFVINESETNDVGPSVILKNLRVIIHESFKPSNNETNNVALVQFNTQGISMDPPIFEHFKPIGRTGLPTLNYCSVITEKIHLASPPEEKVLINAPGCCETAQAYCSVFADSSHSSCNSVHGSPVICSGTLAGFVIKLGQTCTSVSGRLMIKYHSISDFTKFIDYHILHQETTVAPPPTPGSAKSITMSLSAIILISTLVILS